MRSIASEAHKQWPRSLTELKVLRLELLDLETRMSLPAKRLVFGKVEIDMIAGPSEILILADKTGNADWIAADLLGAGRTRRERTIDLDHRRPGARLLGRKGREV